MAIHVITQETSRTFPDATGWHVDDNERLHITVTGKGNCATFHPTAWVSVERGEDLS